MHKQKKKTNDARIFMKSLINTAARSSRRSSWSFFIILYTSWWQPASAAYMARHSDPENSLSLLVWWFVKCAVCCFFVAGYRLLVPHGSVWVLLAVFVKIQILKKYRQISTDNIKILQIFTFWEMLIEIKSEGNVPEWCIVEVPQILTKFLLYFFKLNDNYSVICTYSSKAK